MLCRDLLADCQADSCWTIITLVRPCCARPERWLDYGLRLFVPRGTISESERQIAMSNIAGRRVAACSPSNGSTRKAPPRSRLSSFRSALKRLCADPRYARPSIPGLHPTSLHADFLDSVTHKHLPVPFPSSSLLLSSFTHPPFHPYPPQPSDTQSRWCNQQFSASLAWVACVT